MRHCRDAKGLQDRGDKRALFTLVSEREVLSDLTSTPLSATLVSKVLPSSRRRAKSLYHSVLSYISC
jgi:hypothetical protein